MWSYFFKSQFRLHYLALHDPFCGFLWARRSCDFVILWDHGLGVPWECRFGSLGHAVVFQLLDSGEKPMAMDHSDTVMPTCRNPGRLDMADTAETGLDVASRGLNGHVAEGYVDAHMSAELAGQKVAGCSQRGYRCRRSKWCRLSFCEWWRRYRDIRRHCNWWWRTGRHWTWVFGVGHLLWVRQFLLDWDENWEMQLILSTRWGWTDSNLAAELPLLISTNLIETKGYLDKSQPRISFDILHSF